MTTMVPARWKQWHQQHGGVRAGGGAGSDGGGGDDGGSGVHYM